MSTVSIVANQTKQPHGGYLNPNVFERIKYLDMEKLYDNENIGAQLIGITVDYLLRFMVTNDKYEAFKISLIGASFIGDTLYAKRLLDNIKGLDSKSIISACKLSGYDVITRAGIIGYKPVKEIEPDRDTIENIKILVERSLDFFSGENKIKTFGFTITGAESENIQKGDGDYLSYDTLWDLKVSKNKITNKMTLQIIIYYLMGKRAKPFMFSEIKKVGFYNPRLNESYVLEINKIDPKVISRIESEVIGYKENKDIYRNAGKNKKPINEGLKVYTVTDIVDELGKSRSQIYKDIESGKLIAKKVSNKYVVDEESYKEYKKKLENEKIKLYVIIAIILVVYGIFLILHLISLL